MTEGRCCKKEMVAYVSHLADGGRVERVADHLREVADMASDFARPFGAEQWAHVAGKSHDIGKYSVAFQRRVLQGGTKVDHSTAGAWELFKRRMPLLAYCVAGHHGGLPDGGAKTDVYGSTLAVRLRKAKEGEMPSYGAFAREVELPGTVLSAPANMGSVQRGDLFPLSFLTRMLFSCLVDADYLCTERFMRGAPREGLAHDSLDVLLERLEGKVQSFYPPTTGLNATRCEILDACAQAALESPGVFSLTVPTGGGKTYASLRFALRHALADGHDMRRVIYVAPYMAIIEQNAEVFRKVLGAQNVLEHHANFDFDDAGEDGRQLRLATENWDVPIITTTTVQLFESLFSNKPSRCRKLHNIAKSVIVLDEAQMLPTKQLLPCVRALAELVLRYGCSVVLCTATQPSLDGLFAQYGCNVREIVSDPEDLYERLRRVEYRFIKKVDDEDLAARLASRSQVLCVVNSRKQARNVYDLVKTLLSAQNQGEDEEANEGEKKGIFHLSTLMHPVHREKVLSEVRTRLEAGEPCRVVSTSLIEAGVDVDFPVVYRALAGIDSMVQCAGRCNREARCSALKSCVFLFESATSYGVPSDVNQKRALARSVMADLLGEGIPDDPGEGGVACDIGSLDAIASYFDQLLDLRSDRLDAEKVLCDLSTFTAFPLSDIWLPSIPFADAAVRFRVIDEGTHPVIVPDSRIENDLCALREGVATFGAMRRLARYAVNLYDNDIKAMKGAIELISGDTYVLLDRSLYREDTGLDASDGGGKGLFM